MDVGGRVVAERAEVDLVQEGELLEEHRTLAPRPAAMDVDVAESRRDGGGDGDPVSGEVVKGQQSPVFPLKLGDGGSDVARVERVSYGLDSRLATSNRGPPFLVDQELEGAREVRLHEHLPGLRRTPVRKEYLGAFRLSLEIADPFLDRRGYLGIHGKSIAGETDGRLGGITKADGPVPFEEGKPGIRGSGGRRSAGCLQEPGPPGGGAGRSRTTPPEATFRDHRR